jgi:predicted nuclease with TOPRIM domain
MNNTKNNIIFTIIISITIISIINYLFQCNTKREGFNDIVHDYTTPDVIDYYLKLTKQIATNIQTQVGVLAKRRDAIIDVFIEQNSENNNARHDLESLETQKGTAAALKEELKLQRDELKSTLQNLNFFDENDNNFKNNFSSYLTQLRGNFQNIPELKRIVDDISSRTVVAANLADRLEKQKDLDSYYSDFSKGNSHINAEWQDDSGKLDYDINNYGEHLGMAGLGTSVGNYDGTVEENQCQLNSTGTVECDGYFINNMNSSIFDLLTELKTNLKVKLEENQNTMEDLQGQISTLEEDITALREIWNRRDNELLKRSNLSNALQRFVNNHDILISGDSSQSILKPDIVVDDIKYTYIFDLNGNKTVYDDRANASGSLDYLPNLNDSTLLNYLQFNIDIPVHFRMETIMNIMDKTENLSWETLQGFYETLNSFDFSITKTVDDTMKFFSEYEAHPTTHNDKNFASIDLAFLTFKLASEKILELASIHKPLLEAEQTSTNASIGIWQSKMDSSSGKISDYKTKIEDIKTIYKANETTLANVDSVENISMYPNEKTNDDVKSNLVSLSTMYGDFDGDTSNIIPLSKENLNKNQRMKTYMNKSNTGTNARNIHGGHDNTHGEYPYPDTKKLHTWITN